METVKSVSVILNSGCFMSFDFSAYGIEQEISKLPDFIQNELDNEDIGTIIHLSDLSGKINQVWYCFYNLEDLQENDSWLMGANCFLAYDFYDYSSYFIESDIQETHEIYVYRIEYDVINDDKHIPVGLYNDFQEVYNHLDYGIHYDVFINMENGKITRVHRKNGFSSAKFYRYEVRRKQEYKNVTIGFNSSELNNTMDTHNISRPIHFIRHA